MDSASKTLSGSLYEIRINHSCISNSPHQHNLFLLGSHSSLPLLQFQNGWLFPFWSLLIFLLFTSNSHSMGFLYHLFLYLAFSLFPTILKFPFHLMVSEVRILHHASSNQQQTYQKIRENKYMGT